MQGIWTTTAKFGLNVEICPLFCCYVVSNKQNSPRVGPSNTQNELMMALIFSVGLGTYSNKTAIPDPHSVYEIYILYFGILISYTVQYVL